MRSQNVTSLLLGSRQLQRHPFRHGLSDAAEFGGGRRGQSPVVWAISEGREAARCVDTYLMGRSDLASKDAGDLPRL